MWSSLLSFSFCAFASLPTNSQHLSVRSVGLGWIKYDFHSLLRIRKIRAFPETFHQEKLECSRVNFKLWKGHFYNKRRCWWLAIKNFSHYKLIYSDFECEKIHHAALRSVNFIATLEPGFEADFQYFSAYDSLVKSRCLWLGADIKFSSLELNWIARERRKLLLRRNYIYSDRATLDTHFTRHAVANLLCLISWRWLVFK